MATQPCWVVLHCALCLLADELVAPWSRPGAVLERWPEPRPRTGAAPERGSGDGATGETFVLAPTLSGEPPETLGFLPEIATSP